jgi:hypothetical protein
MEPAMSNDDVNVCGVRNVAAPDGVNIPVPSGGVGLASGEIITVRPDVSVSIQVNDNGYYVTVNNADPSNNEAEDLFAELTVEGAIATLEKLATQAFAATPQIAFKAIGLFASVLVSVFTSSNLTREIFIRGDLPDDAGHVTYCLLT